MEKKTTLEAFVEKSGITYYKIAAHLTEKPVMYADPIKQKIRGKKNIKARELVKLLQVISKLTNTKITLEDVKYDLVSVKLR